jgi:hypothetical protein
MSRPTVAELHAPTPSGSDRPATERSAQPRTETSGIWAFGPCPVLRTPPQDAPRKTEQNRQEMRPEAARVLHRPPTLHPHQFRSLQYLSGPDHFPSHSAEKASNHPLARCMSQK